MSVQISGFSLEGMGRIRNDASQSFQYLLIRLLLGTVTVSRGNVRGRQSINYSLLPSIPQEKSSSVAVKDFLINYSLGIGVDKFIKITRGDNREFYKEILLEFLNFQIQTLRGSNTSAFIFLYRILERISYSVPLLYASTQSDYKGTFRDLKSILNADVDGELGLFKKFLNQGGFIDRIMLQVVQKISFRNSNENYSEYYTLTCRLYNKFSSKDNSTRELEIKFSNIMDLLVNIRNRFFHSRIGDGRDNVSTIEMPDSDEYFGVINPLIVSFLAIVTLQTISSKYGA